jgi:hypothetical protein
MAEILSIFSAGLHFFLGFNGRHTLFMERFQTGQGR